MPWVTTYCVQHVRLLYWQLKELTELTFWQIEGGPIGASLFFVSCENGGSQRATHEGWEEDQTEALTRGMGSLW